MSNKNNVVLPVVLLLSALAISGCATEPKVAPVAPPAAVEVITPIEEAAPVEAPAKPAVAPAPAPAPVVVAQAPAPKPKPHQAKKKVVKAKPVPPAPVAPPPVPVAPPPAPVVKAPPPPPPAPIVPPVKAVKEPGFLEEYWLWLVILGVAIAGAVAWYLNSQKEKR